MSHTTFNQYSRLSDSLERDLMRDAVKNDQVVSVKALHKNVFSSIKQWVFNVASVIDDVFVLMNEARMKAHHYTGSQW